MDTKRFHKSDSLVYFYNLIEYPLNPNLKEQSFTRHNVLVHASEGVVANDIIEEYISQTKINREDWSGGVLLTCMVDKPDFVVALSTAAVHKLLESPDKNASKFYGSVVNEYELFRRRLEAFAEEMVSIRDRLKAIS